MFLSTNSLNFYLQVQTPTILVSAVVDISVRRYPLLLARGDLLRVDPALGMITRGYLSVAFLWETLKSAESGQI